MQQLEQSLRKETQHRPEIVRSSATRPACEHRVEMRSERERLLRCLYQRILKVNPVVYLYSELLFLLLIKG